MAPMAPDSAEGKQNKLVFLLRLIEHFLAPGSPLDQVRLVVTGREAEVRRWSCMTKQENTTKHRQKDFFHALMIPHFHTRKQRVLEIRYSNSRQKGENILMP
jgi:hypothetical protein